MNICLGLEHNNDQGMLTLTGMSDHIGENDILLLGDGGYHHHHIITPSNVPYIQEQDQKDERSVVEVAIGVNKHNAIASEVVRHSPELHQQALMITYGLTQNKLADGIC